ncbi:MAG: hypothetical protein R3F60_16300 [bacterium]
MLAVVAPADAATAAPTDAGLAPADAPADAQAPGLEAGPADAGPPGDAAAPAPVDAAPADAAPAPVDAAAPVSETDAAPPLPVEDSLSEAWALIAGGNELDALRWLSRHPRAGTEAERQRLELYARLGRHDMGRAAKVVYRMLETGDGRPDAQTVSRLLSALPREKYWRTLVHVMADKRFFPQIRGRLFGMTRSESWPTRWRAVEVIEKARDADAKLARSNALVLDLKRAEVCYQRRDAVVRLGKVGHPSALPALEAERSEPGLCMQGAVDEAIALIRKRNGPRKPR